jgi:hypothetical protein
MTDIEANCMLFGPVPNHIRPHFQVGKCFNGCCSEAHFETYYLLGCNLKQTFRRNVLLPSSVSKNKPSKKQAPSRKPQTHLPPLIHFMAAHFVTTCKFIFMLGYMKASILVADVIYYIAGVAKPWPAACGSFGRLVRISGGGGVDIFFKQMIK